MWIISGIVKFLMVIVEKFAGQETASSTFQTFAKLCIIPFYTDIIVNYFLPMAVLFIFLAGLFEFIAGVLILQSGNLAKAGFVIGTIMNIAYAPLAGIPTIIVGIPFIVAQIWLLRKV